MPGPPPSPPTESGLGIGVQERIVGGTIYPAAIRCDTKFGDTLWKS